MVLTEQHYEILSSAYFVSREGKGLVLADEAYPVAHELAEAGWLERYFRDDEMCWRWTGAAEGALDMSALLTAYSGSVN